MLSQCVGGHALAHDPARHRDELVVDVRDSLGVDAPPNLGDLLVASLCCDEAVEIGCHACLLHILVFGELVIPLRGAVVNPTVPSVSTRAVGSVSSENGPWWDSIATNGIRPWGAGRVEEVGRRSRLYSRPCRCSNATLGRLLDDHERDRPSTGHCGQSLASTDVLGAVQEGQGCDRRWGRHLCAHLSRHFRRAARGADHRPPTERAVPDADDRSVRLAQGPEQQLLVRSRRGRTGSVRAHDVRGAHLAPRRHRRIGHRGADRARSSA